MSSSLARLLSRRRLAVGLGVLFLVAVAIFAVQAVLAARALSAARSDATALANALSQGDLTKARAEARLLQRHARSARSDVAGPLWWIGGKVPGIGPNIAAVHDTAVALDVIAVKTMPVLLDVSDQVDHGSLRPQHGRISPAAIAALAPEIRRAAASLRGPAAQIARIHPGHLISPLRGPMEQVQRRVHEADVAINAAANAFTVLPTMLGGSGPRNYLLLVQNPAEIRAAGGLPGTWVILHADDGRLTIRVATSAGEFDPKRLPMKLTADEADLFGSDWGMTASDATQSPDFPRDAQMAASLVAMHGTPVSAVFSVDPVALTYVLRGTGPVKVTPGTTLTESNAVSVLLNQVYRTMNAQQQNAFYARAAGRIFNALVTGQGNQLLAIRGLVDGVAHHRVFAWSADPTLATVVNAESLTGAFPTNTGTTPQVGIYLNDGVAAKQEYYLRQESSARALSCRGGVQTIEVKARFTSTMPSNLTGLPPYVRGTGQYAPKGHMFLALYLAGPWRGSVASIEVNGSPVTVTADQLDGRQMAVVPLLIAPGQSIAVTATMQSGPGQTGSGQLTWTPGLTTGTDPVAFDGAC